MRTVFKLLKDMIRPNQVTIHCAYSDFGLHVLVGCLEDIHAKKKREFLTQCGELDTYVYNTDYGQLILVLEEYESAKISGAEEAVAYVAQEIASRMRVLLDTEQVPDGERQLMQQLLSKDEENHVTTGC